MHISRSGDVYSWKRRVDPGPLTPPSPIHARLGSATAQIPDLTSPVLENILPNKSIKIGSHQSE